MHQLEISHYSLSDCAELEQKWLKLEKKADCSIFLSWHWIGIWLQAFKSDVIVLQVVSASEVIALGLFVVSNEVRHRLLHSRCLRLHQTGHSHYDQIWIEYNGLLTDRHYENRLEPLVVRYIQQHFNQWDELVIGAIEHDKAERWQKGSGLIQHTRWEARCFGVDLAAIRLQGLPYLDVLSSNTRYQITRSQRLYQNRGDISLLRPANLEQALEWFDNIGPRHLARWGSGEHESGFANPHFVRFHRLFIQQHWSAGAVDIVAIKAGGQFIAIFYNLIYAGKVYFYLGGLMVESDNKLKPGLLGHALCIQSYMDNGFEYYDFMGGEERYKMQLGQCHNQLVQVSLQRSTFRFQVERFVRRLKKSLQGSFSASNKICKTQDE